MYSQNSEEKFISEYFGDFTGHLVDIGANDGATFSNSRALIKKGWTADLYEPHPIAFECLEELYEYSTIVELHNYAIGGHDGTTTLHINHPHIEGDIGLLSTIHKKELERWPGIKFEEIEIEIRKWEEPKLIHRVDFISIDAEGEDFNILKQIDLSEVMMVCIEHNGDYQEMLEHMEGYGMSEIHRNGENIICGK